MQGYLVVISYNFPTQVYPRIFVGNKAAAESVPFLTSLGIVLPPPQYPSPYRQQNYTYITRGCYCYCYHSSPPWYWQFFISSTFALFPITFPKSLHLRHHPCAQPCLRPTKNVRCHLIAHLDHSFHQSQDQLRNPHHQKHSVTTYHHDYASYFSFLSPRQQSSSSSSFLFSVFLSPQTRRDLKLLASNWRRWAFM